MNNIYLNGLRVAAVASNGSAAWFLTDQVDSVKLVLDPSGGMMSRVEHMPYGEVFVQKGDQDFAPKYNSQELDRETNYYFYNARYYDPEISRFVTADSVIDGEWDTQGWNRFAYVKGRPVVAKDPSGHEVIMISLKAEWALGMGKAYADNLIIENLVESVAGGKEFAVYVNKTVTTTAGVRSTLGALELNVFSSDSVNRMNAQEWVSIGGDVGFFGGGLSFGRDKGKLAGAGGSAAVGLSFGVSATIPGETEVLEQKKLSKTETLERLDKMIGDQQKRDPDRRGRALLDLLKGARASVANPESKQAQEFKKTIQTALDRAAGKSKTGHRGGTTTD